MKRKALIYYFTGTGNALWLANRSAGELKSAGFEVELSRLDADNYSPVNGHEAAEVVGIVSPVYGFGLPQIVVKFLRRLPESLGQKAFVFISTGNTETFEIKGLPFSVPPTEGICTWQCAYYLYKKGYDLLLAEAFEMATNWVMFLNAPDGKYLAELELRNSAKIKQLIRGMTEGDSVIKGPGKIMSVLLGLVYLCFLLFARRWLGKTFTVTKECNGC
ncbi:MAG: hypothetical protein WCI43_03590, partial [Candidatus Firestonebacteria bacterium]